jgi:hypothetical protein
MKWKEWYTPVIPALGRLEVGGLFVQAQPGLRSKTLPQQSKKQNKT